MNYLDTQNAFSAILNRRDITPSQLATFMQFGVQRIERELRVPAMEKLATSIADGVNPIPVPGDMLEIISISTQDTVNHDKLTRVDLGTILRYQYTGIPKFYYRQGSNFLIGPVPSVGVKLYINYYADASGLAADADTNWLTLGCPDLLIYAALSYASDYFLDERAGTFESRYQSILAALQNMADQDELENASIGPVFVLNDGYDY